MIGIRTCYITEIVFSWKKGVPRHRARLPRRDGAGLEHARRLGKGVLRQQPWFLARQAQPRAADMSRQGTRIGASDLSDNGQVRNILSRDEAVKSWDLDPVESQWPQTFWKGRAV